MTNTTEILEDKFHRTGTIEIVPSDGSRAEGDEEIREINIAISSEEPYDRWFGTEVLVHERGAIDLKFMESGRAPLLYQHDHTKPIGVVKQVTLGDDRKLRALVRLGKGALASEVWDDIKDGILNNVSVGYQIKGYDIEKSDKKGEPDTYRMNDWYPFEASIVSVPADTTVGVGRSHNSNRRNNPMPETEGQNIDVAAIGAAVAEANRGLLVEWEERQREERAEAQTADELAQQRATEVADIMTLGARFNASDLAREHVANNGDLAQFRGTIIERFGENAPLAGNTDIGLSAQETRDFSVFRLMRAMDPQADTRARKAASFELEAVRAAADIDGNSRNGTTLPNEVMRNWITPDMVRNMNLAPMHAMFRTLAAGVDTAMVGTDHLAASFIDVLRTRSVLGQAGMRNLPGLVGDVSIPRKATASGPTWISAEGGNSTASEPTFDPVTMTPHDLSVSTEMTRRAMQQMTPAIEGVVRMDIVEGMALGIDLGGLEGSGASGQPEGCLNITGVNKPTAFAAVNPTFAEVVAMETAVADDNALMGSLAYVGRTNMRGALKTTAKDSGSGLFVLEGNTLNGYNYLATNQITDGNLYFANWSELMMGEWGGLDLVVDDSTAAASNGRWIRAFKTVDFGIRHPVSFCYNNDT